MKTMLLIMLMVQAGCELPKSAQKRERSEKEPGSLVIDAMAKSEFDGYTVANITLDTGSCSGTLVARDLIVTAAHCFFENPAAKPTLISLHSKVGSQYNLKAKAWEAQAGFYHLAGDKVVIDYDFKDIAYIQLVKNAHEDFPIIEVATNLTPNIAFNTPLVLFGFSSNNFHDLKTIGLLAPPVNVEVNDFIIPMNEDFAIKEGDSGGPCLFKNAGKMYLAGVIKGFVPLNLYSYLNSHMCVAVKPFVAQIEHETGVRLKTAAVP